MVFCKIFISYQFFINDNKQTKPNVANCGFNNVVAVGAVEYFLYRNCAIEIINKY